MKLTPGKLAGMKAVSDARGVIAAAAMDQRGSLKKAIGKDRGRDVTDAERAGAPAGGAVTRPPPGDARYGAGDASYLEVLDAERNRFRAALELVSAERAEAAATVALFQALGGGWAPEAKPAAGAPAD